MKERKVLITWEAIYDIVDIAEYIEIYFGEKRADKFQSEIYSKIYALDNFAEAFCETSMQYRGFTIRKRLFGPSIIFYVIKELGNEVHVLRVLRGERDWKKIMDEDVEYTYTE